MTDGLVKSHAVKMYVQGYRHTGAFSLELFDLKSFKKKKIDVRLEMVKIS